MAATNHPRVFVSYSHDSVQHAERVLQLANLLRSYGVVAEVDQYHVRPPKGWPHWCEEQLRPENSDFVLLICTETYLRRVQDKVSADEGRGVFWEGSLIYDYIYDAKENTRFIPILMSGSTPDCIPVPIHNHTCYKIEKLDLMEPSFEKLYRELTRQPLVVPPPPEPIVLFAQERAPLPSRIAHPKFAIFSPSRLFKHSVLSPDKLIGREADLARLENAWSGGSKKNVVTIVALGGVGKTSLVAHWAASELARPNHGGIERYFDWSFYSQGNRRDGDGTAASHAASADLFLKEALDFFGDSRLAASDVSAWQKGERLAQLVGQDRALLVLDGLEPLQDANSGALRDDGLRALLRGLALDNLGLCLVTTRQTLPDLNIWHQTTALEWELAFLTDIAGAALLTRLGVKGTDREKRELSTRMKGHALTLTLLGNYLRKAHHGDICRVALVNFEKVDEQEQGGHAFRVIAAYEQWFKDKNCHTELAILRMLGLFDRPATPTCLAALRTPPVPGLTDTVDSLSDDNWNQAVAHLVELNLLEEQSWQPRRIAGYSKEDADLSLRGETRLGQPALFSNHHLRMTPEKALDAHPLIREYFAKQLEATDPTARRAAHSQLFNHLQTSVPYWPADLEGLQPLYQAVAHGCSSGAYQMAFNDVFYDRILRKRSFYSTMRLGSVQSDLTALAGFFNSPFDPATLKGVGGADRGLIFKHVGYCLRACGRLTEAALILSAACKDYHDRKQTEAGVGALGLLCSVQMFMGNLPDALGTAQSEVEFGRNSILAWVKMTALSRLAEVKTYLGQLKEAGVDLKSAFAEFEADGGGIEKLVHYFGAMVDNDSRTAIIGSLCRRCDFFLASGDFIETVSSAEAMQRLLGDFRADFWNHLHSGLIDLFIGEAKLGIAQQVASERTCDSKCERWDATAEAEIRLRNALGHFGAGARSYEMSRTLISLSRLLHFREAHSPSAEPLRRGQAEQYLNDAWDIASRGPMRLQMADIHLFRARLFFRENPYPWESPNADLATAEKLINDCGYHRRDDEVADAKLVILG